MPDPYRNGEHGPRARPEGSHPHVQKDTHEQEEGAVEQAIKDRHPQREPPPVFLE
jgi:hypothetical protein